MLIEDLQLDPKLKEVLQEDGIIELYPPQADAISNGLLTGKNFVVAVPTASVKTLIAILAMFSTILRRPGTKAIYLAPLRALASEKFDEFRKYAKALDIRVSISTGDLDEKSKFLSSSDIIIATNEKFDSLIRHGASWLNDISIVVSDEVHLINDPNRGPVLEVVLSLIRRNLTNCQIIALSATISNAEEIADWLSAKLVLSTWRPVKLREAVWYKGTLTFSDGKKKKAGLASDNYGFSSLAVEIVDEGGQAIVFASTRKSAEASAEAVAKQLKKHLTSEDVKALQIVAREIRKTGEKTQLREKLANLVETGSGFHHAGLASGHRKIIEREFRARNIKVVSSSPSLAAGVNLPGRRVIIRTLYRYTFGYGSSPIPVLEYKQMAGRAGRPRYDPYGESIIIARNEDEVSELLDQYIRSDTEEIFSKLGTEPAMRAHILAFVSAGYANDFKSVLDVLARTFWGYQNDGSMYLVEGEVDKALGLLTEAKLISKKEPYKITPFGRRVNELYLDPLSARLIKLGLEQTASKKRRIPDIVYLQLVATTPDIRTYSIRDKDFDFIMDIAEKYSDDWIDVNDDIQTEFGQDIFFTTIKISSVVKLWLDEVGEEEIFEKLGMSSGDLHHLLNTAEWLLHCANEISKLFKWEAHQKTLNMLLKRLKYGVNEELLKLVDVGGIGRVRARALFDAGYKTIESITKANPDVLAKLRGFGPQIARNLIEAIKGNRSLIEDFEDDEIGELENEEDEQMYQESLENFFD